LPGHGQGRELEAAGVPHLRRAGQVVMARGIFSIAQTCSRCEGAGRIIENPCRACRGVGRLEKGSKIKLKIPAGVDTGARLRSAATGSRGAGWAARRFVCGAARQAA